LNQQGGAFNLGPAGGAIQNPAFIPVVVGFPTPAVDSDRLLSDIRSTIQRSDALPSRDKIEVRLDGRNVILRGTVGDDDERRLVEALVRLTPGVDRIVNELQVRE
jgi:osmotically-inducible protein OsmY